MGINISQTLFEQFDKQIQSLNRDADKFESELRQWELSMQSDLKENNHVIAKFNTDVDTSLVQMSQSLNQKYRQAKEYQDKVRERMDDLEHKVYKSYNPADAPQPYPGSEKTTVSLLPTTGGRSIPELERERTNMELDLTSDILGFN